MDDDRDAIRLQVSPRSPVDGPGEDQDLTTAAEEAGLQCKEYARALYGNFGLHLLAAPLEVALTGYEKHDSVRKLEHFTLFRIRITHGPHTWMLAKREKDIRDLHDEIVQLATLHHLEVPGSTKLPNRFRLWRGQTLEGRMAILQHFLQAVADTRALLQYRQVLRFFGISRFSFVREVGRKGPEGLVKKKGGGHRFRLWIYDCCRMTTSRWQWLVLKDSFLMYISPEVEEIRAVLLFDPTLQVSTYNSSHQLVISNAYRDLTVRTNERHQMLDWVAAIQQAASSSPWAMQNPHGSFAPVRPQAYAHWFVDGRDYFGAVSRAIELAEQEIFIADWWLSPELHLRRPPHLNEEYRLDRLLARKAAEGVKVCVVLYKNVELAVGINSVYSKLRLRMAHPNISVLRHPDHPPDGVWLWAHHEKICVVDQTVAFIGGLDLCFGRDDTPCHELGDACLVEPPEDKKKGKGENSIMFKVISVDGLPDQAPHPPTPPVRRRPGTTTERLRRMVERRLSRGQSMPPREEEPEEHPPEPHRATKAMAGAKALALDNWRRVKERVGLEEVGEDEDELHANRAQGALHDDVLRAPTGQRSHAEALLRGGGGNVLASSDLLSGLLHPSNPHLGPHALRHTHTEGGLDSHGGSLARTRSDGLGLLSQPRGLHKTHTAPAPQGRASRRHSLGALPTSASRADHTQPTGVARGESWEEGGEGREVGALPSGSTFLRQKAQQLRHWMRSDDTLAAGPSTMQRTDRPARPGRIAEESTQASMQGRVPQLGAASWASEGDLPAPQHRNSWTPHDQPREEGTARRMVRRLFRQGEGEGEGQRPLGTASSDHHRLWMGAPMDRHDSTMDLTRLAVLGKQATYHLQLGSKQVQSQPVPYDADSVLFNSSPATLYLDEAVSQLDTITVTVISTCPRAEDIVMYGRVTLDQLQVGKVTTVHVQLSRAVDGKEVQTGVLKIEYTYNQRFKPYPTWVGKDYSNPCIRDFFALDRPEQDSIDRWTQPRMPWHDVGLSLYGQAARDVARHFVERWNHIKVVKAKEDRSVPFLLPRTELPDHMPPPPPKLQIDYVRLQAQVLRSCGMWANGIATEHSIMNAYVHAIGAARHYIYIENQFFVTSLAGEGVRNKIGDALYERIVRAHSQGQRFRVYVIMPLMPAFEGTFGPGGTSLQVVMHWQYLSINRGPDSLLKRLERQVGDWGRYITFNCLQQTGQLLDTLATNQVYVHTKLMIVDDTTVICGSANINDRSMLGSRDSEIAALLVDNPVHGVDTVLDGKAYRAGAYAYGLRKRLFGEHLGLEDSEAGQDVVGDEFFFGVWAARARSNSQILEGVFRCVPNNTVRNFDELAKWRQQPIPAETDKGQANSTLRELQGHIVNFPYAFLEDEYLGPTVGTVEGLVPTKTFT